MNTISVCIAALSILLDVTEKPKFLKRAHHIHITLLTSICCCMSCVVALARFTGPKLPEVEDSENPYHNPNEVRKFTIERNQLMIDEVELGSGNFGCVKRGVLQTEK